MNEVAKNNASLRNWACWLRGAPAWVQVFAVAAAYFFAAKVGLFLAFDKTNVSPVWPPAGLGLAAVFLLGRRAAFGIGLGEFVANLHDFLENRPAPLANLIGASVLMGFGNALEALAGHWLTSFRTGLRRLPDRVRDGAAFVGIAVAIGLVGAAVGSFSLQAGGIIPEVLWSKVFLTWWTGDVAGILVFTPMLLALMETESRETRGNGRRRIETPVLMGGMLLVAAVPFSGRVPAGLDQALMFLLFPVLLWPAFRLGRRETAISVALVSIMAVRQTAQGLGPFAHESLNDSLLLLQGFVAVIAVTLYSLGAGVSARQQAELALKRSNDSLRTRTEELLELTRRQDGLVAERTLQLTESRWAALNMMQDSEISRGEAEKAAAELADANLRLRESIAEAEQLAEEAQAANRAKSEFLAVMSHEIRTPMNGVLGFTQLLLESGLTPKQQQHAEIIHRSGETLLTIINDILDFSKIEAGRLSLDEEEFDPRPILEDVAELFSANAREKSLELVVDWCGSPRPRSLLGDPGRTRQTLANLVGNAVKFTHSGHVVVEAGEPSLLRARHPELAEIPFDEDQLLVCVMDTGIGVPVSKQHLLFQTFSQADSSTTRQFGGTGLGLAISRRLVELMGGTMGMVNACEGGSIFWFTLPQGLGTVPADAADQVPPESSGPVLVVDDNGPAGLALGGRLQSWGLGHRIAVSAEEACAIAAEACASGSPFATVLVDDLKGKIDAFLLAERFRGLAGMAGARIFLMGSISPAADLEGLRALGLDGVLVKPVARRLPLLGALSSTGERTVRLPEPRAAEFGPPCRVLLAEDIVSNQRLVVQILEGIGCLVDVAVNGREAVAKADRAAYDLILMDCQMPEMDGFAATREIRLRAEGRPRVPIIAVTANALEGDRTLCLAAGMDDWIAKPVRPSEIRRLVEQLRLPGSYSI
jgi:signal transduction histidine kinase/CheY-like chemotaxis protein